MTSDWKALAAPAAGAPADNEPAGSAPNGARAPTPPLPAENLWKTREISITLICQSEMADGADVVAQNIGIRSFERLSAFLELIERTEHCSGLDVRGKRDKIHRNAQCAHCHTSRQHHGSLHRWRATTEAMLCISPASLPESPSPALPRLFSWRSKGRTAVE